MKLSANEIKLNGLRARNCATIQRVLVLKICLRAQRFPGLSRNGPVVPLLHINQSKSL